MNFINLPIKLHWNRVSAAFDQDTLTIVQQRINPPNEETHKIFRVTTTGVTTEEVDDTFFGFSTYQDGEKAAFIYCHTPTRYAVVHKVNNKWKFRKFKKYHYFGKTYDHTCSEWYAARRNNWLIFNDSLECNVSDARITQPTNLALNIRLKAKDVALYNFTSDSIKIFKLDKRPRIVCVGKNIAAALTDKKAYFFDLD